MASFHHLHILVGLETDPTLYHGEIAHRPALLDVAKAERVLAHIATELTSTLPWATHCTLGTVGALYDQAQVLRPGLPVFTALEAARRKADNGVKNPQLAIGAQAGCMTTPELQPDTSIHPASLQLLPLLLTCPGDIANDGLESIFSRNGQLSSAAVHSLEEHFQVTASHARFMTLAQLSALFRRQLEHYGFLPLWELLDAAMNARQGRLDAHTPLGTAFHWHAGLVHGEFQTFDWWANHGFGAGLLAGGQRLQTAYADWTRECRRYQAVLADHGIPVVWRLPGLDDTALEGSFMVEQSTVSPPQNAATLTEHSIGDLGTIAVSVVSGYRQMNYYPLQATGVNELYCHIREKGFGGSIDYPGRIRYDEDTRQLVAGVLPPAP